MRESDALVLATRAGVPRKQYYTHGTLEAVLWQELVVEHNTYELYYISINTLFTHTGERVRI